MVKLDLVAGQPFAVVPVSGQSVDGFVELQPHHDVDRRARRGEGDGRLADALRVLNR